MTKLDQTADSLWAATARAAPQTASLTGNLRADVVIVGGGFTGLSAALHLAEAGAKVIVLEAHEIGHGGSGRNVGLVNAGMWVLPDDLPATLGEPYGERLLELLGDAPKLVYGLAEKHGMECEAVNTGTLHCAVGSGGLRQLETRAEQWRRRAAPVHLLSARETTDKTGTEVFSGALLDERAGTIQPLAYARGLAAAALQAGAEIFTRSPVERVDADGDCWRAVTPGGSVTADWVIAATNAYTTRLWPQLREELVHLPYFQFATEPLPSEALSAILPEKQGAWDTNKVLTSFRLDRSGRLILGSVGALSGMGRPVHEAWARRTMTRMFPMLKDVGFVQGWHGMIGMTGDHLPKFHRLDRRIVGFSGYNGRGIAPGTAFGKVLADHIGGTIGENNLPLPVTRPVAQRFRSIRETGIEWGAQAIHLMRVLG